MAREKKKSTGGVTPCRHDMGSAYGGKKEDEGLDIDFGIGKFSLGGLFKGIEKLIDLAGEISAEGGPASGWKKEGEIDLSHLKQGMKGVFGVSIKTMRVADRSLSHLVISSRLPKGLQLKRKESLLQTSLMKKEKFEFMLKCRE